MDAVQYSIWHSSVQAMRRQGPVSTLFCCCYCSIILMLNHHCRRNCTC